MLTTREKSKGALETIHSKQGSKVFQPCHTSFADYHHSTLKKDLEKTTPVIMAEVACVVDDNILHPGNAVCPEDIDEKQQEICIGSCC